MLLPLITDFQDQLETLKALLDKTFPRDDDSRVKSLCKAIWSILKEGEVKAISAAIDRYYKALTIMFREPTDYTPIELPSISTVTSSALLSMRLNIISDEQRPIQLIDAMRRTHLVPFQFYRTVKVRVRVTTTRLAKL
jgi:hypothetical protein